MFLTALLATIWLTVGFVRPLLELTINAYLYIYSSQAQVVAAVYGLTITGYVFVRNQQDRLFNQDESLAEIFLWIQLVQHSFVSFLTILSILAVLLSLAAIGILESEVRGLGIATANLASALSTASLFWTAVFVLAATRPDQIRQTSQTLKEQVDPAPRPSAEPRGLFEQFMREFNAIERMLDAFVRQHLERRDFITSTATLSPQSRSYTSRWSRRRTIRALATEGTIPPALEEELYAIIQYRNALVHGSDMNVSRSMVDRVEHARRMLEQLLADVIDFDFNPEGTP